MIAALFLGFVGITAAVVVALVGYYVDGRAALRLFVGLLIWLLYVGLIGYSGVIRNTSMRPPGIVFLFVPVILFLSIVFMRPSVMAGTATVVPLWILLGLQCFRVVVELFLHQLWIDGLIPKMLTFSGANLDIYVGASAPLIAWISTRGRWGLKIVLSWNLLGLLILANVVVRAVLTSPGPLNRIHTEVPNLMIGTFPFMFIPGLFVPLAVLLHVLAMRAIGCQLRTGPARLSEFSPA